MRLLNSQKLTKFFALVYINMVRVFKLSELYQPTYNPNHYHLFGKEDGKRASQDRVDFMKQNMDFSQIGSYLDIGSQLGYFVFKIAEGQKILAQGLEVAYVPWAYSNAIVSLNDLDNISFIKAKLTSDLAEKLPFYGAISFLNVFHHVVHFEGFEEAGKIMKILSKKCKYFIFETGQYGEQGQYWSKDLAFMGENPEEWVAKYLEGLGCQIIAKKQFSNHLNSNSRTFFICKTSI